MRKGEAIRVAQAVSPTFLGHLNINEYLEFEVFTAVTMKDAVFRDLVPCGFINVSPPSSGYKK
jgi:hypothetical protein